MKKKIFKICLMLVMALLIAATMTLSGCNNQKLNSEVFPEETSVFEEEDSISLEDEKSNSSTKNNSAKVTTATKATTTTKATTITTTITTTSKETEYEEIYNSFIESEFGTYSDYANILDMTGYHADLNLIPSGILCASVSDFNNDNIKELLVVYWEDCMDEYENRYRTVSLQLYRIDSFEKVVLSDEITISEFSATFNYNYQLFTLKNENEEQFICSFDKLIVDGVGYELSVLRINENSEFELCDILIDPGYTSGVGLYHSASLKANEIYESYYIDCDEIYWVNFLDGERFDKDIYYKLINDIIGIYGLSANSISDYTDYNILVENGIQILNIDFQINYENQLAIIGIDTATMDATTPTTTTSTTTTATTTKATAITTTTTTKKPAATTKTTTTTKPVTTTTAIETQDTIDWREIYADQLYDYMQTTGYDDDAFDLYDVDENGIPELVVSPGTGGTCFCDVYDIHDGKIRKLEITDKYGEIDCNSKEHLFASEYYETGGYHYITIYKYENGELTLLLAACDNQGCVGPENATYSINGSSVSEAEYDSVTSIYYDKQWVLVGRQYALYENFIQLALFS